jgi:hypothetical protein
MESMSRTRTDPSANKAANNGPQSDAPMKEVKDERPAQ